MSRGRKCYTSNKTGISQLVFYYTSLIAYGIALSILPDNLQLIRSSVFLDIFYQNPHDVNINNTSSYLDLSPLYGRSQEEQNSVRTFKNGLIKPDTYADPRPSIPPGVAVLLVMYNRFHNFAAKTILAINEKGRFTPPTDKPKDEQEKWLDEQLFQVARASVIPIYMCIFSDSRNPRLTLFLFFLQYCHWALC